MPSSNGTNKPELNVNNKNKMRLTTTLNILSVKISPTNMPIIELKIIIGRMYIIISTISDRNKFPLFSVRVIEREKTSCINPIIKAQIPIAKR